MADELADRSRPLSEVSSSIADVDLGEQLRTSEKSASASSSISFEDVAKFAIASLANLHARNTVIELGGPEALSPLDVVGLGPSEPPAGALPGTRLKAVREYLRDAVLKAGDAV